MRTERPTDRNGPQSRARSFTMIELLVVISVIVILSSGMLLSFQMIFGTTLLQSATNKVITLIGQARELTYTQKVPHMVVINGGDNTVTLYSAGADGFFAIGTINQDDAKDDVVIESYDLDDISTNDRIFFKKALKEYNEPDLLDLGGEPHAISGVFIFTTKGVRFGTRPGDEADDEAIITIDDSTQRVTTAAWDAGTDGDIILYLSSDDKEMIMIRVGPVRGFAETKTKVPTVP